MQFEQEYLKESFGFFLLLNLGGLENFPFLTPLQLLKKFVYAAFTSDHICANGIEQAASFVHSNASGLNFSNVGL